MLLQHKMVEDKLLLGYLLPSIMYMLYPGQNQYRSSGLLKTFSDNDKISKRNTIL